MDTIRSLVDWFNNYAFLLTPLFTSIFILGISTTIFQWIGDRYMRLPMLVIVSAMLLLASFFPGEYTRELYLNLSMAVFLPLVAILLTQFAAQQESWFLPAISIVLLAILLQFMTPVANIGSNIPTTLGTTLIAAVLVAFMLRQEWAWAPAVQEKRLSAAMRKARQEQAHTDEVFGDYFMLISGHDEAQIQQRIDFLNQHDMKVVSEEPTAYDDHSENYFRLIHVQIETVVKEQESVFLSNAEARMQLLAFPDVVKRVYKQLGEVLITRDQKRIDAIDPQMAHIEFKVDVPQKLYSAVLEQKIYDLARNWQYSDDESLQQSVDDLMSWAKTEGLVRR